jgi:polyhydroxyalkanoate synthesis regulator phasin
MRRKLVIAATTGALTLTALGVAAPALAATDDGEGTRSSAVERITDALSGLVDDGSLTQEQADEVAATLGEAGLGGRGGPGGHPGRGPDLATAAEALGMSEEDLRTALQADDATLAGIAEDQGVAVGTLVQALVAAEQERIAEAVADGRLSQEEADERLADLEQRVTERVESEVERAGSPGRGPGSHDDVGGPPDRPADD